MKPIHSLVARSLVLALVAGVFSVTAVQAQSTMAYQGYLTDADGNPLGGSVNLAFALYANSGGGAPLWEEAQANVQLNDGVFSVMLGSEEPLNGVDFDSPLYLGVTVNGGSELAPRVPLGAAPSSLFAHQIADGLAVRSLNGLTDDVTIAAGENVTLNEADGTITINAEAAEAFALPFEGTNETATPAFKITSSTAAAIVASSEGGAEAISASSSGTGDAAAFAQTNSTSEAGALDAFSFSAGYTGQFSHFGQQGYAGLFRSTNPQNNYPALAAGKEDLEISPEGFVNDALIVRGDAPVLGVYAAFEANTRPGIVLAGIEEDGSLVDKWGIVRQFFGTNGLHFTYGLNADPAQNATVMTLTNSGGSTGLSVPGGIISGALLRATTERGETATPLEGAVYADNIVYAWAEVNGAGTLVDGFGCTVAKTATGSYTITLKRSLPDGVSATVTPKGLNDPVVATVVANSNAVQVATKVFNGAAFVFFDSSFYIQVVGRP